jgi:hypothetical protein
VGNRLETLANLSGFGGSLVAEVYELRENSFSGHRVYTFRETDNRGVLHCSQFQPRPHIYQKLLVLMTGDREQMREIAGGPRTYVLKPFSVAELLHAVAAGIGMPASTSAEPPEAALSSGKAPSI